MLQIESRYGTIRIVSAQDMDVKFPEVMPLQNHPNAARISVHVCEVLAIDEHDDWVVSSVPSCSLPQCADLRVFSAVVLLHYVNMLNLNSAVILNTALLLKFHNFT
ncbi:hypothetical protein NP493_6g08034 [Ridgeia piscesae]|uniref:Uncharacterized protein n=1 Tax=Ridgeia piscesae TaxID=27915 RepID=A0AAD9ULQ9_RIDPI|nr:hypothetical protein NP493_6g08034 [Ridgeia piscesae]